MRTSRCFHHWTLPTNIGWNMLPLDFFMSCLDYLLRYSTGWLQALQLVVLAVVRAVYEPIASRMLVHFRTTLSLRLIMFYIYIYILMPHSMIFYFRLPNFHVANSTLFFTYYFSTLILHRRSLDTFSYVEVTSYQCWFCPGKFLAKFIVHEPDPQILAIGTILGE